MEIKRIENIRPELADTVTVKVAGNVTEVRFSRTTGGSPIRKIDKDHGVNIRTGELVEFQHNTSRGTNRNSVARSLGRLRAILNANLTEPSNALWVTLTYAENMRDEKRLYADYHAFWKRFRRYLKNHGHPPAEYIIAAEPQKRGAWHLHCIILFTDREKFNKYPFIPNSDIAKIWGHGFTKVQSLKGVGNPGLYLTAYLGNMELSEAVSAGQFKAGQLAESKDKSKAVIKGARLNLYPPGFNLYRCSRGIKRPEVWQTTEREAQAEISGMPLTYEKTISITDASGAVRNIINYRTYTKTPAESDNSQKDNATKETDLTEIK